MNLASPAMQSVQVIDSLRSLFRFWPFFVGSIIICLASAYIFLRSEQAIYTVYASILIDNEPGGQSVKQEQQQLAMKVVQDEIAILQSRTIMEQVVEDLDLTTSYYVVADFNLLDIYPNSPVKFSSIKSSGKYSSPYLEVVIRDKQTYSVTEGKTQQVVRFDEQVTNSWGSWKLIRTAHTDSFIGQTIRIYIGDSNVLIDHYLSSFNAVMNGEHSAIVQLSVQETIPERGADVINEVINAYNAVTIDYKNKVNQSTLNFLTDRLDAITIELNSIEKRIEQYKSSRGITDLTSESQVYLDNAKNNDSKLNEVNVQLEVINEIQKYINSPTSNGNAPAITGISDPGLVSLIDQLIRLESQRERLLANTPEKNPVFIPINRQINTTKNAIRENIKGIKRGVLATKNKLQQYNRNVEASIRKLPGQEREYINIKRQQGIKEELYIFLLQKREEAGMNNASKLLDSRIVDAAYYGAPALHDAKFTYALALIFGLIFPGGILYARQALTDKVVNASEIEQSVNAPMIGELSYQKSLPPMLAAQGSRTIMAEQFRILRTKLSHINGRTGNGKVTLLTSGIPGEGKSMICRNLGAVMAAAGRKTVIVDADLRKPQLANALQLTGKVGLSDYLCGTALKEQIIQSSNFHPDLFVISAGAHTEDPSELLEKPAMQELIEWLRIYFDEILIDTPPVELVTDALIITKYSDATLYVLRQNYTYKSQLKSINQLWLDGSFSNLQIVFNGVTYGDGDTYARKYGSQYYTGRTRKFCLPAIKNN